LLIEKFDPEKIISAVYLDNEKLQYNVKRFKIETTTLHTKFFLYQRWRRKQVGNGYYRREPILIVQSGRGSQIRKAKLKIIRIAEVMGWKA